MIGVLNLSMDVTAASHAALGGARTVSPTLSDEDTCRPAGRVGVGSIIAATGGVDERRSLIKNIGRKKTNIDALQPTGPVVRNTVADAQIGSSPVTNSLRGRHEVVLIATDIVDRDADIHAPKDIIR